MADINYNNYWDEAWTKAQQRQKEYDEQRNASAQSQYDQMAAALEASANPARDSLNKQMENVPQQYDSIYRNNAIQERVNRTNLQEAMANMGLADSGLNRTQNTAFSLMRGNADSETRLQQQQAVDALAQSLAELESNLQLKKDTYNADIFGQAAQDIQNNYTNLWNTSQSLASSLYGTDTSAALQREQMAAQKAQWEAEQKAKVEQWERELAAQKEAAQIQAAATQKASEAKANAEAQAKIDEEKLAKDAYQEYVNTIPKAVYSATQNISAANRANAISDFEAHLQYGNSGRKYNLLRKYGLDQTQFKGYTPDDVLTMMINLLKIGWI